MAVGIRTNTDSETLDTSPGGLFTNPDDVTSIDLSTVEGHLNDAVDGARNAKGWAVGNPDDPLDGWTITNNAKAYAADAQAADTLAQAAAGRAAASATAAAADADRANISAIQAAASEAAAIAASQRADSEERAARQAATEAAASALAASNSASDAATDATRAETAADRADSDLNTIRPLVQEIRDLREEIRQDSEEIAMLQQEIAHDSEEIANALVEIRIDSEEVARASQLAEVYATGDGMRAGEGVSRDRPTLGVDTVDSTNFVTLGSTEFVAFPFAGFEGASNTFGVIYNISPIVNDASKTITLYQNYRSLGNFGASDFNNSLFGGHEENLIPRNSSRWISNPANGDVLHAFVTDLADSEIPTYESAYFQALRALEFQDEARQFDSDARQRDSEITSLVNGANARIDSEKIVRRDADLALGARIDSEDAALDAFQRRLDSDLRIIHERVTDAFDVGYGLEITHNNNDTDIVVDTDVIASRRYVDSEIAGLLGISPGIYTTLTRIREALDSDETVLDSLVAYMDSDRIQREMLADDLREDIDSDARAIEEVGRRIDSEQAGLNMRIDSDNAALDELRRRLDSDLAVIHSRVTDAFDVGYGLEIIHNANDTDIVVDTDIIASRRYVDSEIRAQERADSEIHTRIDSEIIALRSRDSELFARLEARLDSEGGSVTTFRSLTDTPTSYDSEAGNFPRVNTAETRLEFFNPFPVASNNRLTELNGLRIRTIGTNFIEFVSFAPMQRVNAQTLNWDAPVTGFGVAYTNNDDFQDEFINRVSNFRVGTTAITGFNTVSGFTSSGTITSSSTFLSNQAWDGSSDTFPMTSDVLSNLGNTFTATGANLTWRGWSADTSTDIGGQLFDTVDTSYVARLTINDTTDITNNVSNALFTPANAQSGSAAQSAATTGTTTSVTFSGLNILSNTRLQGTVTGTATKPATVLQEGVDSDYDFSHTWDATPTTQHRVWFIVASSTPTFATPGNGGYTNPTGTIIRNDNTTSLARGRNQYGNGQTGVNLYVIGNGTINSIQETTNVDFPIAQTVPDPTQLPLGHTGNTFNYNVYQIPLADNAGNFYTIT